MGEVSYYLAFTTGLLSFFTACVLPLLPMYFGYLAGEAIQNLEDKKVHRKLMINAFAFVLGVTALNILLGFGAKAASMLLIRYSSYLRVAGGILLILFGLYFIIDINIAFFNRQRKFTYKSYTPSFIKSLILGFAFSFGWTPCSGPLITSILMMATLEKNYIGAGSLMLVYSLGFSVMFILSAALVGVFIEKVKGIYQYFKYIKWVSGGLMIIMGLLLILNKVSLLG